jgi:hypothetical protein
MRRTLKLTIYDERPNKAFSASVRAPRPLLSRPPLLGLRLRARRPLDKFLVPLLNMLIATSS